MSSSNYTSSRQRRENGNIRNNKELRSPNRRPSRETWGHKLKKKEKKTIRIAFVNVNGIGKFAKDEKSEGIRDFMVTEGVDVMGVAETNVNWGRVHQCHTLWDRTKQWFRDRRLAVSYNIKQRIKSTYQPGGTATIATNDIAHRFQSSGFDQSGLGRWSWIRVTGKQKCITRFVTVYAPQGRYGMGTNTVYEQHLDVLKTDPIQAFWDDLAKAIVTWQCAGEQLVLMGDWNESIAKGNLTKWMKIFGLTEAITKIHGDYPPPTYQRGKDAIDGIFVSPSVKASKAGYLGFGFIPGDHRGIWIDIPHKNILGYKMDDIPVASARRLKLDDPRVVAKYQEHLDLFFASRNMYSRLRKLRSTVTTGVPLNESQAQEYEALDKIRKIGMKVAERKCRKLKKGRVQWSPAIQHARDTIRLWTLIRKRLKKGRVGARLIVRLKKKLKITTNTKIPLEEVEVKLKKAYKEYKVCKKNDKELRRNFLESLAEAKALAGNRKASTVLKDMIHREEVRTTYRRIKYATKQRQSGTTKIHITKKGKKKEITKKQEMEKYIMRENEEKFHQTEGRCPLLHGQLFRDLGTMGDGPRVSEVLKGTYVPPPGTSKMTRRWLKQMKRKDFRNEKHLNTTLNKFRAGWKLMKEQTASGELHMGHFKAGASHKNLGWVHYQLSMVPMMTGYSPKRWRKGIDIMLLKDPEVYLVEKLRTIVLYEADFNHENKRLGRKAMNLALSKKLVADEQFSRPGRSAQDNTLSKRLLFDYYRLIKKPFAMCSCDLKSCYDRVVHSAASLALQRVGIPLTQIQCMFTTIQQLSHRIRTAFGLSKKSYGGTSKKYRKPPQGMGQGNGAGPTIWAIISSTIFEELHSQGASTEFCYALSNGLFWLCGFAYVDDSDLIADGDSPEVAHAKLQKILKKWDKLMEVNGGAIATDKCWWYLVGFEWQGGKWKYVDAGSKLKLKVRDKESKRQKLKYLKSSKAKEMVGVYLAPNGNQDAQLTQLRKKASKWAKQIRASPLDEQTVWIAMNRTIIKGLEYPLAATTLSEDQLENVISPVLQTALPRAGFARNFPRAAVYGPTALQGLGVTNLYEFQYCRHIQDMVDQTWKGTPPGNLIHLNMDAVKVEAGVYWHLFDNPLEITWFNTTNSWIIETYRFCRQHSILFEEPGVILRPKCLHDEALMSIFVREGYSTERLLALNRCRLYTRVVAVSDLTDGTGTHLAEKWVRCPRQRANSEYRWPAQGMPTRNDWALWDIALREAICKEGLTLKQPLGHWTLSETRYREEWDWFLHEQSLVHNSKTGWMIYPKVSTRRRKHDCFSTIPAQTGITCFTGKMERTVVIKRGQRFEASGSRQNVAPSHEEAQREGNAWEQIIYSHPHAKWIGHWISIPAQSRECAEYMYESQSTGVSDGSFDEYTDVCTAAWILTFGDYTAKGGGIVPGPEGMSSAYRGELGGLLGQLLAIWALEQCHPPTKPYSVQIACDGQSALFKALTANRQSFTSRHKSFDIISQITVLQEQINGTLVPVHVYGHQDELNKKLSNLETLNIRMDSMAKEILQKVLDEDRDIPDALPLTPKGLVQVDYGDIPVTSSLASTLRFYIAKDRILDYWESKGRFKSEISIKEIDWIVLRRTSEELSFAMGRFVSKWTTHHIGVGRMMELRQARAKNSCPRCDHPEETTLHVLRCRNKASRKIWRKGIRKVEKWMENSHTHPEIGRAISATLRNFNKDESYDSFVDPLAEGPIRECLQAQVKIGWVGFLEGLFSTQWAKLQEEYFRSTDLRRSGLRWAVNLSKQLWKLVFTMWDHRNTVLFTTSKIDELSGIAQIKQAILQEKELGLGKLDPSYAPYLTLSSSSFSNMKTIDLRRWLSLIRQAREESGYIYTDEIATNKALRDWVGLSESKPVSQHQQRAKRKQRQQIRFIRTGYID